MKKYFLSFNWFELVCQIRFLPNCFDNKCRPIENLSPVKSLASHSFAFLLNLFYFYIVKCSIFSAFFFFQHSNITVKRDSRRTCRWYSTKWHQNRLRGVTFTTSNTNGSLKTIAHSIKILNCEKQIKWILDKKNDQRNISDRRDLSKCHVQWHDLSYEKTVIHIYRTTRRKIRERTIEAGKVRPVREQKRKKFILLIWLVQNS